MVGTRGGLLLSRLDGIYRRLVVVVLFDPSVECCVDYVDGDVEYHQCETEGVYRYDVCILSLPPKWT